MTFARPLTLTTWRVSTLRWLFIGSATCYFYIPKDATTLVKSTQVKARQAKAFWMHDGGHLDEGCQYRGANIYCEVVVNT